MHPAVPTSLGFSATLQAPPSKIRAVPKSSGFQVTVTCRKNLSLGNSGIWQGSLAKKPAGLGYSGISEVSQDYLLHRR